MESKRKIRKVRKVVKATPAPPKSEQAPLKPTSAEALIRHNGELVEGLFNSQVWKEIVLPLLQESVAGVSGRYTNGRFYRGDFTSTLKGTKSFEMLAGYQMALEEFNNRLHDFVIEKEKLKQEKKEEEAAKKAPIYNPFLEDLTYED